MPELPAFGAKGLGSSPRPKKLDTILPTAPYFKESTVEMLQSWVPQNL